MYCAYISTLQRAGWEEKNSNIFISSVSPGVESFATGKLEYKLSRISSNIIFYIKEKNDIKLRITQD